MRTDSRRVTRPGPGGAEMGRRVVVLVFGLIQIVIGARIVLLLLDAREANGLVSAILNISQVFVAPFEGMLRTDSLHAAGSVLDLTAVVALVGWTILELIVLWVDRHLPAPVRRNGRLNASRHSAADRRSPISARALPGGRDTKGRAPMGIIAWIVLGAIAGFVANLIMGGGEGLIMMVVLGIVGAVVGGFVAGTAARHRRHHRLQPLQPPGRGVRRRDRHLRRADVHAGRPTSRAA